MMPLFRNDLLLPIEPWGPVAGHSPAGPVPRRQARLQSGMGAMHWAPGGRVCRAGAAQCSGKSCTSEAGNTDGRFPVGSTPRAPEITRRKGFRGRAPRPGTRAGTRPAVWWRSGPGSPRSYLLTWAAQASFPLWTGTRSPLGPSTGWRRYASSCRLRGLPRRSPAAVARSETVKGRAGPQYGRGPWLAPPQGPPISPPLSPPLRSQYRRQLLRSRPLPSRGWCSAGTDLFITCETPTQERPNLNPRRQQKAEALINPRAALV